MMKSKRRLLFLAIALLLAGSMWLFKPRIQFAALQWIVLHEETPGDFAMRDMVDQAPDRADALRKLWATKRIVPREFVTGYLREKCIYTMFSTVWPHLKPEMMEALSYGDMETQQGALTVLEAMHDADAVPVALAMLGDVDPSIRYLALVSLEHTNDPRIIPVLMRMLEDKDRSVRTLAAGSLSTMTDKDFGLRYEGDESSNAAALAEWKKWWDSQKETYAEFQLPPPAKWSSTPLGPAPDFVLPDLDGNNVRMSDLKGKPVLLVFWATWNPPCIKQIPALAEFHKRYGKDGTILAVNVDDLKDAETGKRHQGLEGTAADRVRRFVADHEIPYRVVVDTEGRALGPLSGGDLPVAIWIDRTGVMRRRFTGMRSAEVLAEMMASLDGPAVLTRANP